MAMEKHVEGQPTIKDVPYITAATKELERRGHDAARYRARVLRPGEEVWVIFVDKDAPEDVSVRGNPGSVLGNPGALPGLEVEIDPADYTVKRSHYIR